MFEKVIELVISERTFQDHKFGEINKNNTPKDWLPILMEEVGEVAKAIQIKDYDNLRLELIQVAAVSIQWLEHIYAKESTK